jgi:hypothetical protein
MRLQEGGVNGREKSGNSLAKETTERNNNIFEQWMVPTFLKGKLR